MSMLAYQRAAARNRIIRWTTCLVAGHRWRGIRADYRLPDDGTRPYRLCTRCRYLERDDAAS